MDDAPPTIWLQAMDACATRVILTQCHADAQSLISTAGIDHSIDLFVRDHLARPLKIVVDAEQKVLRSEVPMDIRVCNFEDEVRKVDWLSTFVARH